MSPLPKGSPLRLDPNSYQQMQRLVLERDGWRCQFCGSMSGVEVHHINHRSQGGSDCAENLIALCSRCHKLVHRKTMNQAPWK